MSDATEDVFCAAGHRPPRDEKGRMVWDDKFDSKTPGILCEACGFRWWSQKEPYPCSGEEP